MRGHAIAAGAAAVGSGITAAMLTISPALAGPVGVDGRARPSQPPRLWYLTASVLFEADDLVLTRQRSGAISVWRATLAGWEPASVPSQAGGDELVVGWNPAGQWP